MYHLSLEDDKCIHIGIVMAGAVTAGAYTAGVMDYLINTLKLWDEQKKQDPATPTPNVKLDVMTGASAGSIATAVTLLGLATGKTKPVEDLENDFTTDNLLFYTWVNLGLERHEVMWQRLLDTSDLKDGELNSLFNTQFIDDLVVKIVNDIQPSDIKELPDFVNPDIEILMTLSNLRGVPILLSFSEEDDEVAHSMIYHKAFAHFQYGRPVFDKNDASKLPLTFTDKQLLKQFLETSRASGAFPIGLRSSKIQNIEDEYIHENLKVIFGNDVNMRPVIPPKYSFLAVDGGMTNNEPIAEALRIMHDRHDDPLLILIDPFPNYQHINADQEYDLTRDSVFDITPQLIRTLRNQVLFKESDILELFADNIRKSMIWPTRYEQGDDGEMHKKMNPIACGALDGFAGFLSREFRVHDFMLGQKNCQNFLRYYFHLEEAEHPYASEWSEELKQKLAIKDKDGKWKLPIIPDFRITNFEVNEKGAKKFSPRVEEREDFPDFPKINVNTLFAEKDGIEDWLEKRVEEIIEPLIVRALSKNPPSDHTHPWILERMKKRGSIPNIDKTALKFMNIDIDLGGKQIVSELGGKLFSKKITNTIMNLIIQTLSDYELFANDPAQKN